MIVGTVSDIPDTVGGANYLTGVGYSELVVVTFVDAVHRWKEGSIPFVRTVMLFGVADEQCVGVSRWDVTQQKVLLTSF